VIAVDFAGAGDLMYEHRTDKLLSSHEFAKRVLRHLAIAALAIGAALGIGIGGYHYCGRLHWIDALVDASMILGGMGPVNPLTTNGAKLFASSYALFSGLIFIGIAGVLVLPFFHRLLHSLHVDEE
jgi:hypothetical protein